MRKYIGYALLTVLTATGNLVDTCGISIAADRGCGQGRVVSPEFIRSMEEQGVLPKLVPYDDPATVVFDHSIEDEIKQRDGLLELGSMTWGNFPRDTWIFAELDDLEKIARCSEIRNNVRFLFLGGPEVKGGGLEPREVFRKLAWFPNLEIVRVWTLRPFGSEVALLQKLTKLKSLIIGFRQTVHLPPELYQLSLEGLELRGVKTNSVVFPDGISRMKKLKLLKCLGFHTVVLPADLRKVHLDGIQIRGCGIGNEIYDILPDGIKWLDLSETKVSQFVPARLMSGLKELYLYGCQIRKLPDPLILPRGLKVINLANNKITRVPAIRPEGKFIWTVYLDGNPIKEISKETVDYIFSGWLNRVQVDREVLERVLN